MKKTAWLPCFGSLSRHHCHQPRARSSFLYFLLLLSASFWRFVTMAVAVVQPEVKLFGRWSFDDIEVLGHFSSCCIAPACLAASAPYV